MMIVGIVFHAQWAQDKVSITLQHINFIPFQWQTKNEQKTLD